jgi:hypothetical protein
VIEITPNWGLVFVHFTAALFSISFLLCVLSYLSSYLRIIPLKIVSEFEISGRWCLWLADLIAICTVLAGSYAFSTVSMMKQHILQ